MSLKNLTKVSCFIIDIQYIIRNKIENYIIHRMTKFLNRSIYHLDALLNLIVNSSYIVIKTKTEPLSTCSLQKCGSRNQFCFFLLASLYSVGVIPIFCLKHLLK